MATTEELLAQLENNPEMYADESQELVIDAETRTINIPASETLFGVKGDKNIERKYFRCPRIVGDNVDLSTHLIYIAYVYTESNSGSIFPTIGIQPYHCDDVEVDGGDITFSWKLSDHVFQSAGFIAFKMYAKEKEDSPYTVFNTAPAVGTVLYTIGDGEESVVSEYPDIINQLLAEMESVQEIATPEAMQNYVNVYLEENPPSGVEIDSTLTQEGKAADAKITGEELEKRISKPDEIGVEGQVLSNDSDGNAVWKNTEETIKNHTITMEKTDFCRKINNVYYDATEDYNKGRINIDDVISDHSGESLKAVMYGMTEINGYIMGYSATFGYSYSYYSANIVISGDVKYTENEIPYIEAIITPEQIQEAQQKDNFNHIWVKVDNTAGVGSITRAVIIPADYEITDELIDNDFSQEIVSDEFVHAVNRAIEEGDIEVGDDNIKELNGKIMLSLGDSFTAHLAGAYTDGVSESTSGRFHDLANKYGMTLYSYGIVSSTIKTEENGGYSYQPMATRVDKLISDHLSEADNVGVITFMGGVNDSYGRESSLGNNIADMSKGHTYGACHYIFSNLLNNFPNAEIFVILQPCGANRTNDNTDYDGNDTSDMTDIQFSTHISQVKQKIVREVAEFYGLNIVDCCFDWYNPNNPSDLVTYWGSDKLHLTDNGYKQLSKKLEEKIKKIFE